MKRTSRRPRRNPSPLDNPAFRRWFGNSKVVDERGEPLVVYHGSNAHAYSPGERIEVFGTRSRGGAFFSSDPRIASQYGERVYAVYLRLDNPLVLDAGGRSWTDLRGDCRIDGLVTVPVRAALRADQERRRRAAEQEAELLDDLYAELADVEPDASVEQGSVRRGIDPGERSLLGHTLADLIRMEPGESLETDDVAKAARGFGFDGVIFRNVQDSPARGAGYSRVLSDVYAAFSPTQVKSATDNVGTYDPSDPSILKNRRSSRPKRTSRRRR